MSQTHESSTRKDRKERKTNPLRRATETALDVAIGGTALAADKAIETAERLAGRTEEMVREGVEEARDRAEEIRGSLTGGGRDARPYEERTRDELYALAAERDVAGRSRMTKDELVAALRLVR